MVTPSFSPLNGRIRPENELYYVECVVCKVENGVETNHKHLRRCGVRFSCRAKRREGSGGRGEGGGVQATGQPLENTAVHFAPFDALDIGGNRRRRFVHSAGEQVMILRGACK